MAAPSPAPHFVLSYGRADGPHVAQFHEDLADSVRNKHAALKGLDAAAIGYMDTRTEHGDHWDAALLSALRRAKTYIGLISVTYLASDYCGREFAVFQHRVENHAPELASGNRPKLIKPVMWQPEDRLAPLPEALRLIQHSHRDYGAVYREKGLGTLIKQVRYRDDYEEFLDAFGWALVKDAEECELPEIAEGPTLDEVVSPFLSGRWARTRGRLVQAPDGAGSQIEAQDIPQRVRSDVVDEFGVEPRAPHESSLRSEKAGNLPAEVTSFVGRIRELGDLKTKLAASRLVTLTGGGGVGKSRLALRAAREHAGAAWLVDLAGLHDPALLAHAIADVLSIPRHSTENPLSVLTKYLRDRQLLLVLDNCEHLVEACAALVAALLYAAPGLRVLVTSRHALRIAGEHIMVVNPLGLREESVELFRHRAGDVQPGFTGETAIVERICARLEGIPLAIELAAVRTRLLTPDQILDGLEDRYQLLAGGRRAGLPHHQTLRAAVDLSYDLCTPQERTLWARLSVFADSFDLDAVKAIYEPESSVSHLDLVDELLDKSVLARVEQAGCVRLRMLDTLRQYGLEKLRESGDAERTRRLHRNHFLKLADRGDAEWFGRHQEAVFIRTRSEHANLREALDFCLNTPGETQVGVHLAGALWFYWVGCGFLAEGRHWLNRALAAHSEPTTQRAKALWVNGYIATLQGDLQPAVAMLEECRDTAPDEVSLAYAVHRLGCNALVGDDIGEAVKLLADARARYSALKEMNSNVVLAGVELALAWIWQGELGRATVLCEEIRATCEEKGELWAYAYVRYVLGLMRMSAGDVGSAVAHAEACLRIKHTLHDQLGMVLAVELLAWIAAATERWERAAVLLGAAQVMWSSVGFPLFGSRHFTAPHQSCLDSVRLALGTEAFEAAVAHGTEMSVEQAVALALDQR